MKEDIFILLSQKLIQKGYICGQASSPESTLPLLQDPLNQVSIYLMHDRNRPVKNLILSYGCVPCVCAHHFVCTCNCILNEIFWFLGCPCLVCARESTCVSSKSSKV